MILMPVNVAMVVLARQAISDAPAHAVTPCLAVGEEWGESGWRTHKKSTADAVP